MLVPDVLAFILGCFLFQISFFFNNHIKHLVGFGINYPNIIGRLEISFFNTESNYTKRVTTGIFAGVGMMSLVAIVVEFLQIRIWRLIF